jgi:hypothetical protein
VDRNLLFESDPQGIPAHAPFLGAYVQYETKTGKWSKRFLETRGGQVFVSKNDKVCWGWYRRGVVLTMSEQGGSADQHAVPRRVHDDPAVQLAQAFRFCDEER